MMLLMLMALLISVMTMLIRLLMIPCATSDNPCDYSDFLSMDSWSESHPKLPSSPRLKGNGLSLARLGPGFRAFSGGLETWCGTVFSDVSRVQLYV